MSDQVSNPSPNQGFTVADAQALYKQKVATPTLTTAGYLANAGWIASLVTAIAVGITTTALAKKFMASNLGGAALLGTEVGVAT